MGTAGFYEINTTLPLLEEKSLIGHVCSSSKKNNNLYKTIISK